MYTHLLSVISLACSSADVPTYGHHCFVISKHMVRLFKVMTFKTRALAFISIRKYLDIKMYREKG